ncbi:MAG: AAA family ATPase [Pseudonocardia sp.]|nr:AAA family ATPase [Pseudonocardia sp.]
MQASPGGSALVGRDAELGDLVGRCLSASGGVTLVLGEAGSGKTRLLDEVAARASSAGALVGRGHAVPGGGPFRPMAEALSRIADPSRADELRIAPFRSVLARVLPGWQGGEAAEAHLVDPVVVLGEALLELVGMLSAERQLVLALDDLHWADRDTLSVLEYLAGAMTGVRVRVLAAARSDERLPGELETLHRHARVHAVDLRRLDPPDVGRIARACLGAELAPDVLDHVVAAADGLPLLAEELCAGLVETGAGRLRDRRWEAVGPLGGRVPDAFAEIVLRRVGELRPDQRAVLHTAALLGRDLPWQVLPAIIGTDVEAVAGALRAAVDARLLVTDPGDATLRWRHALTQDAVLGALTGPERSVLAAHAADALDGDDVHGQRLALVAELHARGGSPERAAELLLRHAREHRSAAALATGRTVLERAVVLAAGHRDLRVRIAIERVEVLTLAARVDQAIAVAEAELTGAAEPHRSALLIALARACVVAERFAEARRHLDDVPDSGDPRVRALAAHVALGAGQVEEAVRLADSVADDGEEDGVHPEAVCEALEIAGRGRRRSDPARSRESFVRAERLASRHGLTPWRIRALSELGVNDMLGVGDGEALRRAEGLALECGMLGTATMLELQQTALCSGSDGMVAAMPRAERCAERARRLGLTGLQAHAVMFVARGRVFADRVAEVDGLLDEAAALSADPLHIRSERFHLRAFDAWLSGDPFAAGAAMDSCVDVLRRAQGSNAAPGWGEQALLRTVLDPADPAPRDELRASDVLVQALNVAALHHADAVASAHRGRDGEAAEHLVAADALLVHRPFHRHLLRALLVPRADDRGLGGAVPMLHEMRAWLAGTGEIRMTRWCRERLHALGAPVPRPGRDASAVPPRLRALGITGRELEVLRLLADGLGNPEIATRLQLSRRTVETHVSRLLAKTGASGRRELCRWSSS